MHFKETAVAGAWIVDPSPRSDDRGRFMRAWCTKEFEERGIHFLPHCHALLPKYLTYFLCLP